MQKTQLALVAVIAVLSWRSLRVLARFDRRHEDFIATTPRVHI